MAAGPGSSKLPTSKPKAKGKVEEIEEADEQQAIKGSGRGAKRQKTTAAGGGKAPAAEVKAGKASGSGAAQKGGKAAGGGAPKGRLLKVVDDDDEEDVDEDEAASESSESSEELSEESVESLDDPDDDDFVAGAFHIERGQCPGVCFLALRNDLLTSPVWTQASHGRMGSRSLIRLAHRMSGREGVASPLQGAVPPLMS